ncbi:MAG: hypothetical protein HOP18_18960 [Deltaproteobacteria bacterium]|nr:hypothetical protein [Deltaproteobacteria bacterium]
MFDLQMTVNLQPVFGLEEGTVFINYLATAGRDGSRDTGDLQKFSNIDTNPRSHIDEFWYEQWLADKRVRFKLGRVRADSEFAFVERGGDFLHSSPGHSPTIFVMPVYPDAATSINLFVYPTPSFHVGFGLYDGALGRGVHTGVHGPQTLELEHLFFIGEMGTRWVLDQHRLIGRLGVGAWGHNGTFERFSGGRQKGTMGAYLVFDQLLWRENPHHDPDEQGIAMFLQYGYADGAVSEITHHFGGGLTWTGLLPQHNDDVSGIGTSWVTLSELAGFDKGYELALELFYKIQLTSWITLQPDLQYLINPSGGGRIGNALVGSLRIQLVWS